MKCPLCQQALVPQQLAGITVDVCGSCTGIWFDPGEFGAYGQMTGTPLADSLRAFQHDPSIPPRECPRCHTLAIEFGMAGKHPLFRCGGCTGTYLVPASWNGVVEPSPGPHDHLGVEVMDALLRLLHDLLDANAR